MKREVKAGAMTLIAPAFFIAGSQEAKMELEILKRDDVAALLQIHSRTVDHLVYTGQIPFSRIGKRNVRFDKDAVIRWFRSRQGIPFRRNMKNNGE